MTPGDPYADAELAALYDLDCGGYSEDLDMYAQFAARGERSLELGVGSGRVALHLARLGHSVTGIDASPAMLSRLEARLDGATRQRLTLADADMRDFALSGKFDLIYCPLFGFEHMLSAEDQAAVLARVSAHLAPGGVLVAELRTLRAVDWSADGDPPLQHAWTRTDPDTGDAVTKLTSLRPSSSSQTTAASMIYDRSPAAADAVHRRSFEVALRITPLPELALLLRDAGLRVAQTYGGPDLSPYNDGSDSMIVVAEARM